MWVDPMQVCGLGVSRDPNRVIRGVGCLDAAVKNIPNPVDRAQEYAQEVYSDLGLRLAMTVPCNVARVVVQ